VKNIIRILLGLVGGLIVLLILAAVVLPLIYDKEDLKKVISTQVYEQTGRVLSIDGALDFSVFPWLAVEVNDLSLSNAKGFSEKPFARIGRARVGVALIPLFQKQIKVDEITLDELELMLEVNKKGQNNWDDLADGGEAEPAANEAQDDDDILFTSQRIAGLNIRDARIEIRDQQAGTHYRLSGFTLHTGALGDGQPVPLELSMLIEDLVAGTGTEFDMSTTLSISLPAQTLQLESFTVQLAGLDIRGDLSAEKILDDPAFNGSLTIAEFSPLELMQTLQMEVPATADPEVLQRALLSTSFSGDSSQLSLNEFKLELDQSLITGEMSIRNFDQAVTAFEFAVDEIDIDRYMEPAGDQAGQEDVAMPREELQDQDVRGNLQIGKMRLAGLDFSDAELKLVIRGGKLRLNPLTAGFYGGKYSGDIMIDSSGAIPVLSLDEKIDSISFGRLFEDLVDNDSLSGTAFGHVRLTGRGASSNAVMRSLSGDLGLTLTEGALEGINIWYEIRRGLALYKGLEAPPAEPDRTVFSRMQLSAGVEDGVVTTRELIAELPYLTLSGNGTIDLGKSRIDLALVATVRDVPELENDPLATEISGKSLPFKISGPLDDPVVALDWEALLKSEATEMLLEKLGLAPDTAAKDPSDGEQEKTSTEDQLKESVKSALFDLFSDKDEDKDED